MTLCFPEGKDLFSFWGGRGGNEGRVGRPIRRAPLTPLNRLPPLCRYVVLCGRPRRRSMTNCEEVSVSASPHPPTHILFPPFLFFRWLALPLERQPSSYRLISPEGGGGGHFFFFFLILLNSLSVGVEGGVVVFTEDASRRGRAPLPPSSHHKHLK